ncbi:type II toxin-antitoxin system RelE/ParE family toxin [Streptomyces sp. NPDC058525]|uniref:type II toxin-antitoxin system RelE family toxin n=1 Tax=Streptomyces sp. NPDC058525 TaxID=3346538 RepID=UPI00365DCAEC
MSLILSRAATRALHRLERADAREHARIRQHLAEIDADPTGRHSTALVHLDGRRSRCGSWRLVYELGDPIRIRAISHRRNAYTQKG